MLWTPPSGLSAIETHVSGVGDETSAFLTSVTAGTSLAKNGTYTQLIASTAYDAYGIYIIGAGLNTAGSSNNRCLVDIAIGGSGSEVVIVPNLTFGNVSTYSSASNTGQSYYFPIRIPAGSRVSATAAASTDSDVVSLGVRLLQHSSGPGMWYGSRVTAYGADLANVRGTSHSPGNASYATATQITASSTNPIRYMQIGYDLLSDTTGADVRGLVRIGLGATPVYVVSDLPIKESTTQETPYFKDANFILSHMRFNIPAGTRLAVSAQRNVAAEGRGFIIYGVD